MTGTVASVPHTTMLPGATEICVWSWKSLTDPWTVTTSPRSTEFSLLPLKTKIASEVAGSPSPAGVLEVEAAQAPGRAALVVTDHDAARRAGARECGRGAAALDRGDRRGVDGAEVDDAEGGGGVARHGVGRVDRVDVRHQARRDGQGAALADHERRRRVERVGLALVARAHGRGHGAGGRAGEGEGAVGHGHGLAEGHGGPDVDRPGAVGARDDGDHAWARRRSGAPHRWRCAHRGRRTCRSRSRPTRAPGRRRSSHRCRRRRPSPCGGASCSRCSSCPSPMRCPGRSRSDRRRRGSCPWRHPCAGPRRRRRCRRRSRSSGPLQPAGRDPRGGPTCRCRRGRTCLPQPPSR